MEQLNQQQAMSLVTLTKQLEACQNEIKALQARISSLEKLLRNQEAGKHVMKIKFKFLSSHETCRTTN